MDILGYLWLRRVRIEIISGFEFTGNSAGAEEGSVLSPAAARCLQKNKNPQNNDYEKRANLFKALT